MTDLTAVSLFAGIGGFDLALQRAGVKVVAAVEIDPAARSVLARRFPEVTLFEDVREVTGDQLRAAGFVPERGILTAGFPCQDLSVAGRRGGMGEGTRSGLYWEIDRLLAELHPAWVLLENVPGLLSAVCPCPGTGEHQIPVAFRTGDDGDDPVEVKYFPCSQPHAVPSGHCNRGCFAAHGGAMGLVLGSLGDRGYGFAYRVLDAQYTGVPQRRRRVIIVGRAGGDARGPVQVLLEPASSPGDSAPGGEARQDVAGTLGSRAGGSRSTDLDGHGAYIVGSLTTSSVGGIGGPDDNTAQAGHLVTAPVTSKWAKGTGGPAGDEAQNLLPVVFDAAQITSATNRSNPQPGDPAPSLAATGSPYIARPMAFNPQTGGDTRLGHGELPTALTTNQITAVQIAMAVRRLTPLECERLQGFPDQWTAGQADAPRYRELGNAVAVPVIEQVAHRIVAVDSREVA